MKVQWGVLASDGDPYALGVEYTCELGDGENKTFYVLENNDDTVSLIMNMNIDSNGKGTTSGNLVEWCNNEDYLEAGGTDLSGDGGMCQYSGLCARSELGPLTVNKNLKQWTKNWKKLDESQISIPSKEQITTAGGWEYANILFYEVNYWTSSVASSYESYYVDQMSSEHSKEIINFSGVRPVITISKSQLG